MWLQGALLQLPQPFAQAYLLPCKVTWLPVEGKAAGGAGAAAGGLGGDTAALLAGRPRLQGEGVG